MTLQIIYLILQMTFKQNEFCKSLCDAKVYKKGDKTSAQRLNFLKKGILQNYQHHWYVLNLLYHKVLMDLNVICNRSILRKFLKRINIVGLLTTCRLHGVTT